MRSSTGSGKVAGPALKLNTRFASGGAAIRVIGTLAFLFLAIDAALSCSRPAQIPAQIIRTNAAIRGRCLLVALHRSRYAQLRASMRHYMNEHAQQYPVMAKKNLVALFASDSGGDCAKSKPSGGFSCFSAWRPCGRFYGNVLRFGYRLDPLICEAGPSRGQGYLCRSQLVSHRGINRRDADPALYSTILPASSNSRFPLRLGSTLETPRLDTLNSLPVD